MCDSKLFYLVCRLGAKKLRAMSTSQCSYATILYGATLHTELHLVPESGQCSRPHYMKLRLLTIYGTGVCSIGVHDHFSNLPAELVMT
jgi:hypothetical protein